MNKVVWKFSLLAQGEQAVKMPKGAEVLSAGIQREEAVIWALVDEKSPDTCHTIYIRGTGHAFTGKEGRFIGTLTLMGGTLVYHVFDGKES